MTDFWILYGITYLLAATLMYSYLQLIDHYDPSTKIYPKSWYYVASSLWFIILVVLLICRFRRYIRREIGL